MNSYWSIILVDVPGYRVVPNPLKQSNFNTYSSLKSEPDGSLKIGIGSKPIAGVPESLVACAGRQALLAHVPDLRAEGDRHRREVGTPRR